MLDTAIGDRNNVSNPNALVNQGDGTFKYKDYVLTKKGLLFLGNGDPDQWEELGRVLFTLETSLQIWIGDWLVQAERTWGVTYSKIAEMFDKDVDTLYNYQWVCGAVHFSLRGENLNFSHYKAVAALTPENQNHWLRIAEAGNLSARAMERQMRKEGSVPRKARDNDPGDVVQAKRFSKYIENELPGLENAPQYLRENIANRAEWLSQRYAMIAQRAREE
jgi:hypothetical protein